MGRFKENKILLLLLLTGAVFLFLKYIVPLMAPVLAAMLFVTIFGNPLKKLQVKMHIHRQIGAVLLLALALVILALVMWILLSWLGGCLPGWLSGLDVLERDLAEIVENTSRSVGKTLGLDSIYLERTLLGAVQEGVDYFQLKVVPGMLSGSLTFVKVLGGIGGFLITFLIATVLLAKDYDAIMNRLLDREEYHMLLEVICGIIRYIATFVKAQLIILSVLSVLGAMVLGIAGVEQGVMWGVLGGVLDVFPFVGTGIVLLPLGIAQMIPPTPKSRIPA